jgi:hypothetical protein
MLFFWNKWNKWNKARKSLILKTLFCSVAQNISRTISGFPLVDRVGKNNYALTQSITKTKGQSAEVAQCPKWLVRRLQPVPFIFRHKKTQPELGKSTAIGTTK